MIRTITSPTLRTFKRIDFQAGLNVLVADKTASSTDKQTRNSAGKTSLIEIIHFLFGADCDKDSFVSHIRAASSPFPRDLRTS